jgi:diguanylate cyclase (GGDEF)-like protein
MKKKIIKTIISIIIFAGCYYLLAVAGLKMAVLQVQVSPICPPSGLALAVLLIFGYQLWPGIFIGAFLLNLSTGVPVWVSLLMSAGNAIEALAGVWLLGRMPYFQNSLQRLADAFGLIFLAALSSTLVGSIIGTVSLYLGGILSLQSIGITWVTWWLGDAIGILIVAPFILSWVSVKTAKAVFEKVAEFIFLVITASLAGFLIFSGVFHFTYFILPFLIWSSFSFGQRGSSLVVMIFSVFALWNTLNGVGPFSTYSSYEGLMNVGSFLMIISCTGMVLSAAIAERKQAHEKVVIYKKAQDVLQTSKERLESLLTLSQMSEATEKEIREFALESVVRLTRSEAGYLHFVSDNEKEIELVSWSKDVLKQCSAVKEPHYPVDKAGIWADSIRLRKPVIHNDYQYNENRKGYPDGHFHIERHMSIPIFDNNKIVAVSGVANKKEDYDEYDINQYTLFMKSMWFILKQKRADVIARKNSIEDGLTGIANRRHFDNMYEIEWRRAMRGKYPLSLIFLDIDFFKPYNDIYGHRQGDKCLVMVAKSLKEHTRRPGDMVARYGGEEFVVILPNTEYEGALSVAEKMRETVWEFNEPHKGSGSDERLTISAGVASVVPEEALNSSELVEKADTALYTAKAEGRNCVKGIS